MGLLVSRAIFLAGFEQSYPASAPTGAHFRFIATSAALRGEAGIVHSDGNDTSRALSNSSPTGIERLKRKFKDICNRLTVLELTENH